MPIITVSRQLGAGGADIAAGVAKALSLRIITRETIEEAAREAGVPQIALQELGYEGRRGVIQRILDALKASPEIPSIIETQRREPVTGLPLPPQGMFTPPVPLLSAVMEDYVRIMGMVILDMAREGNVLIMGRAGQVLLRDNPQAFHVQVVAALPHRTESVMRRLGITQAEATKRILDSDHARADHLRRYYGVNWLDPQLYDLVINTSKISIQTAVQLVVLAQVQHLVPGEPA